jgi:hypothetical protein
VEEGDLETFNVKTRFAILLLLALSACVPISKRQSIDPDVSHWGAYAFSEGSATATIKVPPGLRTFSRNVPEMTYNSHSQRLLLDAQYDYGRPKSFELDEFEIIANFIKLTRPLKINATPSELDSALTLVFGRPINADASPKPTFETIGKQAWIYYDNSTIETVGMTRETYGTMVNETTALLITGWYLETIRKDPAWFESRRALLRSVRDNIAVLPQ